MAFFNLKGIEIKGVSSCVPEHQERTENYSLLSPSEQKMFIKTVGVESRHVAPDFVTTNDLCCRAAETLLSDLKWEKESIEILIFVTQSRDYYLPSTAIIAQHNLKLPTSCMSFDIGLGCSGYVYGLSVIMSIMKQAGMKRGLLLAGDVSTLTCAYEDKSTYPLFGDAGTATAVESSDSKSEVLFDLNSDGSGKEAIIIPHGGMRNQMSPESFKLKEYEGGIKRSDLHLALDGMAVFNFSITKVPPSILAFLKRIHVESEDIDYFIMHQANLLMNETIRKKVNFPKEKTPNSLKNFGNTSSASIPLTMCTNLKNNLETGKSQLLLSGFGVGFSWANAMISTSNLCISQLSIYK